MKSFRIWRLKRQARHAYFAYQNVINSYSCGALLAGHISAQAANAKVKFNQVMDALAILDPTAPDTRL